jgi:hypothetical protein
MPTFIEKQPFFPAVWNQDFSSELLQRKED